MWAQEPAPCSPGQAPLPRAHLGLPHKGLFPLTELLLLQQLHRCPVFQGPGAG